MEWKSVIWRLKSNVVNENGPSKVKATDDSHNQRFNAIDDLLLGIARIPNHVLFPVSMQLHHVKQTVFLLGFNVIDVALWENCSLKLTGNYTGLQVFLVFNIVGGGISPSLGSTLRKRWRVLTTHAFIRFKFFDPGIFFSNVKISNRDMFLFQRISLDQNNIKSAFDTDVKTSQRCQLSTIQSWVGQKERRLEMSVISQLEDDHFYIKVFTAAVEKDFSKEQMTTRFFTKNTIIVEESEVPYEENFQVFTYYCPPLENKDKSLNVLAEHDCGTLPKKETIRLSYLKKRATNDIFILQFGKLGRMIEAHFRLKEQSKFLFILGPNDPGASTVLSRCALPKYLSKELQKHVPNAILIVSALFDPWGQGSFEGRRNVIAGREANNGHMLTKMLSRMLDCMEKLVYGVTIQEKISKGIYSYKNVVGNFERKIAVRVGDTLPHAEWWSTYGIGMLLSLMDVLSLFSNTNRSQNVNLNF
ncbi:hypothetical protein V6N11_056088 [Hibiscus sabdariffa]|uniref:Uncharacterized protein n=1 Tax=Hibiscus sabdariffa TaxID=183260 RepID=A0ABR2T2T4_9ROSI